MFHKMGFPLLVLVIIMTIGSGESRSTRKLPEPPQDGAAGLHLDNGLDDCGEDSHSSCDTWVKSGECERDPEVKQSCSFSCSLSGQLWEAARTGELSAVETTLVAGANPLCPNTLNEYGINGLYNYTAIHMDTRAGHLRIIETLLNAGVDVNLQTTEGKTPIYIAALKGNIVALDILIENNANVNIPDSHGWTPLLHAAQYGKLNITRALIKANASIDVTGGYYNATALHRAVYGRNQDIVLLLIEHNANVNIPKFDRMTPLMSAAVYGELSITRSLIKANASLDVTGGYSNATALYYAIEEINQDTALLLIEHNANVNIPSSAGVTPLMSAARHGELNITRALINANASLDVTGGRSGATALHRAAKRNNQDVAVLLMDNGADSNITNNLGFTPSDLARSKGHNQLADLIKSYPITHRLILSR